MEYVITTDRPFDEIEAQTLRALERQGFVVQQTFSLHSALLAGTERQSEASGKPGYSVLLLFSADARRQPLGLVTLYERANRTVVQSLLTPLGTGDVEAELAAALARGGLAYCVQGTEGECLEPEGGRWVQDPVCGKWLRAEQAQTLVEYQGRAYPVCCPLCEEAFVAEPDRYARREPSLPVGGSRR